MVNLIKGRMDNLGQYGDDHHTRLMLIRSIARRCRCHHPQVLVIGLITTVQMSGQQDVDPMSTKHVEILSPHSEGYIVTRVRLIGRRDKERIVSDQNNMLTLSAFRQLLIHPLIFGCLPLQITRSDFRSVESYNTTVFLFPYKTIRPISPDKIFSRFGVALSPTS